MPATRTPSAIRFCWLRSYAISPPAAMNRTARAEATVMNERSRTGQLDRGADCIWTTRRGAAHATHPAPVLLALRGPAWDQQAIDLLEDRPAAASCELV